jgi:hypothetical protein
VVVLRWTLTLLTWVVATAVLAPVCFFAVWILAGPHSDLLSDFMGGPTLILGWLTFVGAPIWFARVVWRRLDRGRGPA